MQLKRSVLISCFYISLPYKNSVRYSLFCCFAMLLSLFFIPVSLAASQLMITPTRIVFSDKMRSASVTIINNGDSAGTYRISMVNKRMNVDGGFEDVKEAAPGELFSDSLMQ